MVQEKEITEKVIGAAIEVHHLLGSGLLESAHKERLCYKLSGLGGKFGRRKGLRLGCAHKLDSVGRGVV